MEANKLTPSPQLVGLAKSGLIPGRFVFSIGGMIGIIYFLGEYFRTNQEQPVILVFIVFIILITIVSSVQVLAIIKFMKMKVKDISLQVDSDQK